MPNAADGNVPQQGSFQTASEIESRAENSRALKSFIRNRSLFEKAELISFRPLPSDARSACLGLSSRPDYLLN
jgi:hypothetical protein